MAQVAVFRATKRTSELIPHAIRWPLSHCTVEFTILHEECAVLAECTAKLDAKTGVEMEALTGVSRRPAHHLRHVGLLTRPWRSRTSTWSPKGGRQVGTFTNHGPPPPAVVAISGVKNSGKTTLIAAMLPHLTAAGLKVAHGQARRASFQADPEGTDTGIPWRPGLGTAIFDGEKYKVVRRDAWRERELIARFPDADLVLLEGFQALHLA